MLTLQDSTHFGIDPTLVNYYYGLGQRISQLTYNTANGLGSGVLENRDGGLTARGRTLVDRMQEVGMAIDLSHCGDQTTLDVLDATKRPVLFTHTACRSLIPDHPRAKTDEMIRKMAAKGGVMGLAFIRFFIRDREPVNIGHVIDHVDHVRKLVGIEHVGVGSDLDITGAAAALPFPRRPVPVFDFSPNGDRMRPHIDPEFPHPGIKGLEHGKRMFDLTEALIGRRYSDGDIKLILGGNAVRALGNIWQSSVRN
jgi:membrane dipeptidase